MMLPLWCLMFGLLVARLVKWGVGSNVKGALGKFAGVCMPVASTAGVAGRAGKTGDIV